MSDATLFAGLTLAGATIGTIGNVTRLGGTGQSREMLDVSTADSVSKALEFISGMKDSGEMQIEVNYDGSASGVADALQTAFDLGAAEVFTITYVDTTIFVATGTLSNLGYPEGETKSILSQSLSIKFTGVVTYTDVA